MPNTFVDQLVEKIKEAPSLYNRLVLVVAPSESGKTSVLREAQKSLGAPLLNINLEISRRMLELTDRQRTLQVPRLLEDILREANSDMVFLDNIEILFEVSLKQEPLRLLQGISRNRTIIATWNGEIKNNYLIYATPEHPEYKRYPAQDLLIVSSNSDTC